jgi:hypothetical protein
MIHKRIENKKMLFSWLILSLFCIQTSAQKFSVAPCYGISTSKQTNKQDKSNGSIKQSSTIKPIYGLLANIHFGERFVTGIGFNKVSIQNNFATTYSKTDSVQIVTSFADRAEEDINLNYSQFGLYFGYKVFDKPKFVTTIGTAANINLLGKFTHTQQLFANNVSAALSTTVITNDSFLVNAKDGFLGKSMASKCLNTVYNTQYFDVALSLNQEYKVSKRISLGVDLRYAMGLTDIENKNKLRTQFVFFGNIFNAESDFFSKYDKRTVSNKSVARNNTFQNALVGSFFFRYTFNHQDDQ